MKRNLGKSGNHTCINILMLNLIVESDERQKLLDRTENISMMILVATVNFLFLAFLYIFEGNHVSFSKDVHVFYPAAAAMTNNELNLSI